MLSQSTVKSFETASCYRRWQAERTGELPRFVNDPMKKGSYFDIAADYRKSSIDGNHFALFDWSGRRRATIDLRRYAASAQRKR